MLWIYVSKTCFINVLLPILIHKGPPYFSPHFGYTLYIFISYGIILEQNKSHPFNLYTHFVIYLYHRFYIV